MIGQETIDRVRQHTAIVTVIGETVRLQQRGRTHVGLCPFHQEKTPSFHVNEERGFFHCFGCGASGDVFKFVQETQGLSFVEAVRWLAERSGIEIVTTASDAEERERASFRKRQQELYDVNECAATFFERMLREHPLAHHAMSELGRRELSLGDASTLEAHALQAFRVGYAPWGWENLAAHLRAQGRSLQAAEQLGLLVPRKSGPGHYDRFRHRLMFAVIDLSGRVIAFSGRALPDPLAEELSAVGATPRAPAREDASPAKYVNSPESSIYRKRETVFGLYQARQAVARRDECVLVEGNFDVVSLHARGITEVVAPLGTAFTAEQARQIRRFASRVVLLFDGDEAGRRAVRAADKSCAEAALRARVAALPDGADPDSHIRKVGPNGMRDLINAARGILEYQVDSSLDQQFVALDARGRAAKIDEVLELLASEQDPTVRSMAERHADHIAQRLGVTDASTFRALAHKVRATLRGSAPDASTQRATVPALARSRDRREEISLEILGALLDYPELLEAADVTPSLGILEGDVAAAVAALRQSWNGQSLGPPEQVLAKVAPSIHPFAAARLAAPRHERLENAREVLLGNVGKLERLERQRHSSEVVLELQRAAATGDFDQEIALLREHLRRHQAGGP